MNTYHSKFLEFLNGGNTIKISGERDYISLRKLMRQVGIATPESIYDFVRNYCGLSVYAEFQYYKGMTYYTDKKASVDWYGQEPFTMKQILAELKGE